MAITDGLTAAQIRAALPPLEQALLEGALQVEIEGRKVAYRSTADLQSAVAYARQRLAVLEQDTANTRPAVRRARFSRF